MAIGIEGTNNSSSSISGSGTNNYITKWTPDGATLGISQIIDNGTEIGVNTGAIAGVKMSVAGATAQTISIYANITSTSGSDSYGILASNSSTQQKAYGLEARSLGLNVAGTNIGAWSRASGGLNNFCIRLQDGTEGAGKFLKSINANGEANWATLTASDVSGIITGSGTLNYSARWTGATSLGNGVIRDNGTTASINNGLDSNYTLIVGNTAQPYGIFGFTSTIGAGTQVGVAGTSSGAGTGENAGVLGTASGNSVLNAGVKGNSTGATAKNIGGYFTASGGTANYALRLEDGTQGVGKFLKSISANGEANWATISTSDISGYAGLTDGDKGDITVSSSGAVWTIDNQAVTLAKMQHIATNRFLGRTTAGTGDIESLTTTQATAMLNAFTTSLQGVVPASGGGSVNFLRADGTWVVPSGLLSAIAGTTDYLARWTGTTTLGIGTVRDNGTTLGINVAPSTTIQAYLTSALISGIQVDKTSVLAQSVGVFAQVYGASTTNIGFDSLVTTATSANCGGRFYAGQNAGSPSPTATTDTAVFGTANSVVRSNVGGHFVASGANSGTNVGIFGNATGGTTNYAIKLQDGTQGSGKFLKSVTANGEANWANILVSDITNSTSLALGLGSIELGHATDTTITRVSAGVIAVEGVTVATATNTLTLTNKRITSRVQSVTSSATVTPNADNDDSVEITAQAVGLTIASPTGTPTSHQKLIIRIKDNATARAITWNAIYRAIGVTLPTTTVISKTMYLGFIYNVADTKWDCVAVNQEA